MEPGPDTTSPDRVPTGQSDPKSEGTSQSINEELQRLRDENTKLRSLALQNQGARAGLHYKVSEKGALSVYGLMKFPVTLYRDQWETLLDDKDRILQFIENNESRLPCKSSAKSSA
jgi:hypothetical protein